MHVATIPVLVVTMVGLVVMLICVRSRSKHLAAEQEQAALPATPPSEPAIKGLVAVGETVKGMGQVDTYRDAPNAKRRGMAFVSYNLFAEGLVNGWYERNGLSVFIMQNTRGERWGQDMGRESEMERQWTLLDKSIDAFDMVYIYVGQHSTRAIEFARRVPRGKVTFVMCICDAREKLEAICSSGHEGAPTVRCACGGHKEMAALLRKYLDQGMAA